MPPTRLLTAAAISFVTLLGLAIAPAAAPDPVPPPPTAAAHWGIDTAGEVHRFERRTTALVLLGTECPIARKSIATLNALKPELAAANVDLLGLISDPTVSRADIDKFAKEYNVQFPILIDSAGELARWLSPRVTPEAFVIDTEGNLRYRGRIDDAYAALGRPNATSSAHDLRDAALSVAKFESPKSAETQAIGCNFESWKHFDAASAKVNYHRDIAPLMAANCVSCHKAGQVAPFPLTTYAETAKRAELIAKVTKDQYMPPWRAAPQEHRFADERRLSPAEITLLQQWSDAGAPEGSAADALPPAAAASSAWKLGEPDLIIEMPEAFNVPATGRDIYRAFPVPAPVSQDTYITAFEFQPGQPSVVHHAILYLDNSGVAQQKSAASTDGQPGYTSFGGPGFIPSGGLGGWTPGASPSFLPDGVGRPLKQSTDVVFQIHYHPDGKPHADKSRIGLYFAKKPIEKIAVNFPLVNRQIDIPPGESHYTREMNVTLPREVTLIGITPHMHLIGQSFKVTATLPDGRMEQLIDIPAWDFRWQDQYRYAAPVILPAGTKVHAEAVYDNSAANPANPSNPPKRVTRGEQTTDEMCLCFFQLVVDKDNPLANRGGLSGGKPGGLLRGLLQGKKPAQ